jgi:hypothetical protein
MEDCDDREEPIEPGRVFEKTLLASVNSDVSFVADKPSSAVWKLVAEKSHGAEGDLYGDTEAIRVVRGGGGGSVISDRDHPRAVADVVVGMPTSGRSAELPVSQLLVERLNRDRGQWSSPVSCDSIRRRSGTPEDGVDCRSEGEGGTTLRIQVTTPETDLQRELAVEGHARRQADSDHAVDAIMRAIRKKSRASVDGITLALDATLVPSYSFRSVVSEFRDRYGAEIAEMGWSSVWIVGPTVDLVQRLD